MQPEPQPESDEATDPACMLPEATLQAARTYPIERPLSDWISARAAVHPDAVALQAGARTMSYARLEQLSQAWAAQLLEAGVGPDTLVAVCMQRDFALVVAVLAIAKAGGAFLLLDPQHPQPRLRAILDDARPLVLLTEAPLRAQLEALRAVQQVFVMPVDGEAPTLPQRPRAAQPADPSHLAYVVYTSGSTGTPKGVLIEQRGLRNLVHSLLEILSVRSDDVFLLSGSVAFDASLWRFFVPLIAGARLVLGAPGLQADMPALLDTICRQRVSIAGFVPSVLRALLDQTDAVEPTCLRHIICGGEVLDAELARRVRQRFPGAALSNSYGPSEASIACSWQHVDDALLETRERIVPIGVAMPNVVLYVLDEAGRPSPAGVPGELYIGGAGVGRGYLRRAELTTLRFLPDPFRPGERMYRSGDFVRWNASGKLEFLGRVDEQIKLRGLRIELGEIESALLLLPGVREAAVVLRSDAAHIPRLVAYVVATGLQAAGLRQALRENLPEYMVPQQFQLLDALPHLPSGKIDRSSLAAPDETRQQTMPAMPRSPLESAVLEIWQRVLRRQQIGVHDDFFSMGGHSLVATQVFSQLRAAMGVDLPLRALFEHRTIAELAQLVESCLARRAEGPAAPAQPIPRIPRQGPLPVSFSQRRMWLLHQLDPEGAAYNIRMSLRMRGALDRHALQSALDDLVLRHEVFRTRYAFVGGEPVAHVDAEGSAALQDLLAGAGQDAPAVPEDAVLQAAAQRAAEPFDLERGPVHRFLLGRIAEDDHLLVVVMHHIVADDWTFALLATEFNTLYEAHARNRPPRLAARPIDFADYAAWQRRQLSRDALEPSLRYWMHRLSGLRPLDLPTEKGAGRRSGSTGGRVRVPLSQEWLQAMQSFSAGLGVTPFMTLLATFASLLGRWCSQRDVCIAFPVAGRSRIESETLAGSLVNTLLLRTQVDAERNFRDFLREEMRETVLGAFTHQDLPFDYLVEHLRAAGAKDQDVQPRVLFNVLNSPRSPLRFEGLEVEYQALAWSSTQFDLSLSVSTEALPALVIDYSTELFDSSSIEALAQLYLVGTRRVLSDPLRSLHSLWEAPEAQLQAMAGWNATAAPLAATLNVARFLRQRPAQAGVALADATGSELDHRQLWRAVDHLSALLRAQGIGRGQFVGLGMRRGVGMVVAQLAVLESGAAYLPLDPEFPQARLRAMIEDACPTLLLSDDELQATWAGVQVPLLVPPDPMLAATRGGLATAVESGLDAGADDPAYVIYTSGSTGRPKGVLVPHRAVVNFLQSMAHEPGMRPDDVLLAVTTLSFDIAVLELLLGLCAGARVCIASREEAADGTALQARLRACRATMMQATPATWQMLLDDGWQPPEGFKVLVGGEALRPELARRLQVLGAEVWNLYGPTETTVWSTCWRVRPGAERISIGSPIANTQVHVLDAHGRPCPIGFSGEIHIGGEGVALGYHRRPELDAERFLPDPEDPSGQRRMYRTGDRGRWRHDGLLEHQGRLDFQVKLRGYRIETGDIESCLLAQPGVAEAVVVLREDTPGDARLVAYVLAAAGLAPTPEALREALRDKLPAYMIPQHLEVLASLPRLPNGKIDRQALPAPHAPSERHGEQPEGSIETLLAGIWSEMLGVQDIRRSDNFFDLGGHSLLANRVVVALEAATGQRIALRRLIVENLAQLAAGIQPLPRQPQAAPTRRGSWLQRLRLHLGGR